MHKILSKFAGCLWVLGVHGLCTAGEGVSQRVMTAPSMLAHAQHAKAAEMSPTTSKAAMQAPATAAKGGHDGDNDNTLALALLGIGLLGTVVYRAKAA